MNPNRIEQENLSREDEAVRRMIGELPRVDAPKDFAFRLKARIANSKAEDFKPGFSHVFRYAVPLALVLIISAVAVVNSFYSVNSGDIPIISESTIQTTDRKDNPEPSPNKEFVAASNELPVNNSASKETPNLPKDAPLVAGENSKKLKNDKRKAENDGIGSKEILYKKADVINPPGLNPDKKIDRPQDFDKPNDFSVKEVLSQIGIDAAFSENKWKVKSVTQNSLAERSGVKQNDVIEAIDNTGITSENVSAKTFGGKNLTVTRDGKKLEIKLQNK